MMLVGRRVGLTAAVLVTCARAYVPFGGRCLGVGPRPHPSFVSESRRARSGSGSGSGFLTRRGSFQVDADASADAADGPARVTDTNYLITQLNDAVAREVSTCTRGTHAYDLMPTRVRAPRIHAQ